MSVSIRLASADGVSVLAEIQVATWKSAYQGLIDDQVLDSLRPEDRLDLWHMVVPDPDVDVFVSESQNRVVGFVALRSWSENPPMAWLPAIYVRPEYWRQGHGRGLLWAAIAAAQGRSCESLFLWVLEDNARARRFYESQGLRFDGTTQLDRKTTSKPLRELRYSMEIAPVRGGHE